MTDQPNPEPDVDLGELAARVDVLYEYLSALGQSSGYHPCPECEAYPSLVIGREQAMCSSEGCSVIMFNPSMGKEQLADIHVVDGIDFDDEGRR